ncbi:MAG: D-glycero-beta-D-manno-heptose-1,7-bisphosphate 7-phosphatase [Chlamydiae bacterium]|nr:D-glycero-beta-D-manno-heptose-1,7-bisphosphate 7-phosphatase [Chlamydiota bacterium]
MFYIFDLDGTLAQSKSGKEFSNSVEDQELIPGVLEKLTEVREADPNAQFLIASNQGGVAFGHLTIEEADAMCQKALTDINGSLSVFCPEHPEGTVVPYNVPSQYRKPSPGMLLYLIAELDADPEAVVYIGDMDTDELAATAAGVAFEWADDFFGRETVAVLDETEIEADAQADAARDAIAAEEPEASVRIERIRGDGKDGE